MNRSNRLYFENLDGLRFFSFVAVFLLHGFYSNQQSVKSHDVYLALHTLFANGNLGVNFFFVLSGYLITYLLIIEKVTYGKINIVKFWLRRMLRIWPLYYACIFFGFAIFPVLKSFFGIQSDESATLWTYLLFVNNFDFIKHGQPDAWVLGVLWSIAIEEQFYFVWPLLLSFVSLRYFRVLFITVILSSIIFRFWANDPILYEFHTFSCMGDMAIGALGAWLVHFTSLSQQVRMWKRGYIMLLYAMVLIIFLFRHSLTGDIFIIQVLERSIIACLFLMIILEQNYAEHSLFKLSRFKTITSLGIITYGLYCLHSIAFLIIGNLTEILDINDSVWMVIGETVLAFVLTIVMAKISFGYFEQPFLRLKNKFSVI
jgi:peptidoglycan/LPS O-acetylase OafA/YrhL